MTNELSYSRINDQFLAALPELKNGYDKNQLLGGTQYGFIYDAIDPILDRLLDSPETDPTLLTRLFDFLEAMARSDDIEVVNLLHVGIFERLVGEPDRLSAAWNFMGSRTKDVARRAAHSLNFKHNLPNNSD